MGQSSNQRRRRRRPLIVEVKACDADEVYLYTARNLSGGGMFIDTPVPLPAGTSLQLEFQLPGVSGPVRADGLVRWNTVMMAGDAKVKYPGMGVIFTGLDEAELAPILAWVEGS